MQVLSVRVAHEPSLVPTARPKLSGFAKSHVDSAQIVADGLTGDHVVDRRHHGGPEQAVYVYTDDDYAWWRSQLGVELAPGSFGENLTIDSVGDAPVMVGDRFTFGADDAGAVIEAVAARIPCDTFAAMTGQPDWIRRFRDARRPGFYCRVIRAGGVRVGDTIERTPHAGPTISILETQDMFYASAAELTADRLRAALAAPIQAEGRAQYAAMLAELD